MRIQYHEFESLEHLLANRLLPGGARHPIRFVVFGGTGAVGGAAVMELCRLILMSASVGRALKGEIYATGLGSKEISKFVSRMYMALGDQIDIEKIEPLKHYRLDHRIDLRFSTLRLDLPEDLAEHVAKEMPENGDAEHLCDIFDQYFRDQPCPFLRFVEDLEGEMLHAVVVAIPLPSVATYTMGSIDRLVKTHGFDPLVAKRIKKSYLNTFIRGLAVIQQKQARHVVMAHTTAVGGMYRVDEGIPEIRLGFAHSSLGKKLVEKKYFADELTQLFVDHGFDVLVTAAAIGIDAVDFRCRLPSDRAVTRHLRDCADRASHETLPIEDLASGVIHLYPYRNVPLIPAVDGEATPNDRESLDQITGSSQDAEGSDVADPITANAAEDSADPAQTEPPQTEPSNEAALGSEADAEPPSPYASGAFQAEERDPGALSFGQGKDLIVEAAIRSGENGLFSVANCVALYNVMKVAIPEELAMVLVRHAVFGPERRRDWFQDKISYYTETENSYFALRLLDSYPELLRAHHGPFAVQAYQALGSSTHQARLHELGLVMLALRLRELGRRFADIPVQKLVDALPDVATFVWRNTRIPSFQDLDDLDAHALSELLTRLCEADSMESAGRLLGFEARKLGIRQPGREKFLSRLATCIQRYLQTITSLGIPIIYRRAGGRDRVLVGPYVAPLDMAVSRVEDLDARFHESAGKLGTEPGAFRDWAIANNGFVDLRPVAVVSAAQAPGPSLDSLAHGFSSEQELVDWLGSLSVGSYFTTAGMIAFRYRVGRLGQKVRQRKVQLGTRETWKHLFRQDRNHRHLITPGLVETVRMYSEGLGKITGTEALWPGWGY